MKKMNIENLPNEIWMNHPIYTDYAASNLGRIKSIERDVYKKDGTFLRHQEEQLIKPKLNKGYLIFSVWKNGKQVGAPLVHRFCYECFHQMIIPKDIKNYQINHINEDKTDNRVFENLELVSAKANINHGTHNERVAKANTNNPKRSKKVGQYKLNGELVKIWKSTREAERNGFNHTYISQCCNNKYMREENNIYKNFIWKYIE